MPSPSCSILLAASEVAGFAKTGGLADVAGSLPRALAERGHRVAVIMPLYHCTRNAKAKPEPTDLAFHVPVGGSVKPGRLWRCTLPESDVPIYLIEQNEYFDRDDPKEGRGLYQYSPPGGGKTDYADNCARYVFFCRAVLEAMRLLNFYPDILHANDWQTGLAPTYLRAEYNHRPAYGRVRTLFTIHNIAYQGNFSHWDLPVTGLPWSLFNAEQLEFFGQISFLKAGLVFSDLLNTVSPTYAREIQTPEFGYGMQGILAARRHRLFGIVNGCDYGEWSPATDKHLAATFDGSTVGERKAICKAALQRRFGLAEQTRTPLLGMVARLVEQKGIDLVLRAAEGLLHLDTQLVVLGDGDPIYHGQLQALHDRYPERVGVYIGYDGPLSHQIEAGADLFLMPSLFEPCGLNQLYSMKYGTLPVVRATGGLADTVVDCTAATLAAGTATGFAFLSYAAEALYNAVARALDLYRRQPETWLRLMQTAMRQDWSWNRSAAEYERLYGLLRQ